MAIIGASGQLGRSLSRLLPGAWRPSHSDLDLLDPDQAALRYLEQFELVINCAALHDLKYCEENPYEAFIVNVQSVALLASYSAKLIHISTNYVFDGTKTYYLPRDKTNPLSVYGMTKRAGELTLLAVSSTREDGQKPLIIRTAGLYGEGGPSGKSGSFVDKVLSGEYQSIKSYEFSNMTWTDDLARTLLRVCDQDGIIHLVNEPGMSWFGFAKLIRDDVIPIVSGLAESYPPRPERAVLRSSVKMMRTEDALKEYLRST